MSIPELCIKRPVFTIVISIVLVIFGYMHYTKLAIRKLPNIEEPKITITTEYEGASPELVEKEITTPIENTIAGTSGINEVHSSSQLGYSRVTINFKLGVDIQEALSDIRNKVIAVTKKLPDSAKTPTVTKNDSDDNPALILGFQSSNKDALEITDYLKRTVKPTIEELNGVGEVFFFGNRDYAIKIWLNPAKMMSRGITVSDIKAALMQQNIDIPSGQIKSKNRYYTVITHARLDDTSQFQKLILSDKKGVITRLSDVAHIAITSNNDENYLRINGHPAVGFGIIPQSSANPVKVADNVKKIIKDISPSLPGGMQVDVVFDSAKFIKQSVNEVYKTLFEAVIFVVLVVFLFLGNLRAAIIPIITVPICLIASFWPMYLLGFGINTITMLALVLAIGLVVDDAIVMLENIYRHMQQGKSRLEAAIEGSREIVFAIIAMTLTLAAVYAPMGFVQGFTGKLFLHFGLTLSIAVVISGIIALTLSPMMCSKMLTQHSNKYTQFLDNVFHHLMNRYKTLLNWCIANNRLLAILICLLAASSVFLYRQIPAELAPTEDQSYIFGILSSPTNSSVDYTNYYSRKLEKIYETIPEKTAYLTSTRPDGAFSVLNLKPWGERKRSQQQISSDLTHHMKDLVGVNAFPVSPSPLGRSASNNSSFSFQVLTNGSYQSLNEVMDEVVDSLNQYPGLDNVKNNLALDSQQVNININRLLATDLQVKLSDIAETISTMLGGSSPITFNYEGQSYDVVVQLQKQDRTSPAVLDTLYVKSERGKIIPLSSLVTIDNSIGPDSLPHINRMRAANITAEIAENYNMKQVITEVSQLLHQQLPDGYQFRFNGLAKDYLESSGKSIMALTLALVFIYLVMAAQFESFIDPFIILLSVPMTLITALLGLKLTGGSLNIYTNIGMVTLIGLIAKHGILITEFTNQLRAKGVSKIDALVSAATLRLRPILMTTAAMVLGALPLTFAFGAGAESRQQLGIVICFGLALGTFFSLIVVPIAYSLLSSNKKYANAHKMGQQLVSIEQGA